MAIISNNDRYEGATSRMVGFGGDKLILDNRAMDSDMIQINSKTVDIPGHAQELIAGEYACFNNLMTPKKYTSSYPIKPTQIDVSIDNPVFGKTYWTDPTKPDEHYVRSNVYAVMADSPVNNLHKLNDKGDVLITASNNTMFGEIIDANEDYIYTLEYDSTHYNYLRWYDRRSLTSNHLSISGTYAHLIQVLDRTNTDIFMYDPFVAKPYRFDKTQISDYKTLSLQPKSGTTTDLQTSSYSAMATINFTPKMKNGWHYRVAAFDDNKNQPLQFEAITINTNTLEYDTVVKGNMEVAWGADCLEELKTFTVVGSGYTNQTIFRAYKISDTLFVVFKGQATTQATTLGSDKKTAMYVCQVDEAKQNKVTVLRARYFDYLYLEDIIRYDNDKFIFVQEDVASHMYKFNYDTNDFTLSWNIPTPNIVSCCYYNNVFWWLNGSTKELNYETEANTLTIQDRFDVEEITLQDESSVATANYYISVYDSNSTRVEKNVKLICQGPGTFNNDLKELTIQTSLDDDYQVPVKINSAGQFFINVTILS